MSLIAELRRPFDPAAVKFKIQTNPKGDDGFAQVVAYIDARLAAARLDAVCPEGWSDYYTPLDGHPEAVVCALTIPGVGQRQDVGWGNVAADGQFSNLGVKTVYSDAFKRAAVKFGVGASLYAMPRIFVKAAELKKRQAGQRTTWTLPTAREAGIRAEYATWLLQAAVLQEWGEPLAHGFTEESTGDTETADQTDGAPAATPAQVDSLYQAFRSSKYKAADLRAFLAGLETDGAAAALKERTVKAAIAKLPEAERKGVAAWLAQE